MLVFAFVPLAECHLCNGSGKRLCSFGDTCWVGVSCPRCCTDGFIEKGRKVSLASNWFPKVYPELSEDDVRRIQKLGKSGPNGELRYVGYRFQDLPPKPK
jgi:hypothetical protein